MAKNVNNTYFKTHMHFNEQINFILLIMFLSVVLIISLKGCGGQVCPTLDSKQESQETQSVVTADCTANDSIVVN